MPCTGPKDEQVCALTVPVPAAPQLLVLAGGHGGLGLAAAQARSVFSQSVLVRVLNSAPGHASETSVSERTATSMSSHSRGAQQETAAQLITVARGAEPSLSDFVSKARVPSAASKKDRGDKGFVLDLGAATLRNRRLHIEG